MAEGGMTGLAATCRALDAGDEAAIAAEIRRLASANVGVVEALERLIHAEAKTGNIAATVNPLRVLERLLPEDPYVRVRRLQAQVEVGTDDAAEQLARTGPRITHEALLFHVVEFLAARGFVDEAHKLTEGPHGHRPGASALAACRARILFARGRLEEALAALGGVAGDGDAHLVGLRYRRVLQEHLLDFPAADASARDIALRSGQVGDAAQAVERLLITFDVDAAQRLLHNFLERNPHRAEATRAVDERIRAVGRTLEAAVREHGPVAGVDPAAVHAALSTPGAPPSRIVWGKAGLSRILRGSGMASPEFERFQWFLPNWEDAGVRHRVLAAARRTCPRARQVRARWLAHLMMLNAYADAAAECHAQLTDGAGGDALFHAVVLLRLERDGTVPSFMAPGLFDELRSRLLSLVPGTEPGFADVLHDHLVALGWAPPPFASRPAPRDDAEALLRRRLLATATGRLDRRGAATPRRPAAVPRPVVAISGQLRGFEAAWASIADRLVRPLGAPLAISVWDKTVNATGRHAQRLERMLPEDVVARLHPEERYTDTFALAYPRTAALVFARTNVSAAEVRSVIEPAGFEVLAVETEDETAVERLMPGHVSANMLKMYYKFARLEAVLRDDEARTGQTFTHVVWVRPDCDVVRLHPRDLQRCLSRPDIAWSSFVTENEFGDYLMILPRRAFAAVAGVFAKVCLAGDTRLLPWRPARPMPNTKAGALSAFGGPDVIFDALLAAGYMPYNRIPRVSLRLLGHTPGHALVRQAFEEESRGKPSAA